tara:strand:+ start:3206 stop:4000 length:795 start_codon:yes stop_codon:yes gene_type:complete
LTGIAPSSSTSILFASRATASAYASSCSSFVVVGRVDAVSPRLPRSQSSYLSTLIHAKLPFGAARSKTPRLASSSSSHLALALALASSPVDSYPTCTGPIASSIGAGLTRTNSPCVSAPDVDVPLALFSAARSRLRSKLVKKLCTSTFGFVSASLDTVVVVVVVVVVRSTAHTVSPLFVVVVSSSSSSSSSSSVTVAVAAASASSVVLARFRARGAVPASIVVPPPSSPSPFARAKNDAIDLVDAIVVAPFARAETRTNGETDE